MKKIPTLFMLIIVISSIIISPFIYRNLQYKKDFQSLFGKEHFFVVNMDNGDIKLYTMAEKNSNEEYSELDIVKNYMNKFGYNHLPDQQLGRLHIFSDSNGEKIECDSTHFRNYTEWYIHFKDD